MFQSLKTVIDLLMTQLIILANVSITLSYIPHLINCQNFLLYSICYWFCMCKRTVDHLVNNAGILKLGLFEDCSQLSNFNSIMDINFWGSVYCTKFAIPHLRKSKGKIVAISSCATSFSAPRSSFYNASKAAQKCFFETLRAELGSDIGITIVSPGIIQSEMSGTPQFESVRASSMMPSRSTEACMCRGNCGQC
ncbi:hypothetical protein ABKV19_011943 [Rosa sericea]